MDCKHTTSLLLALQDGQLSPKKEAQVRAHLEDCAQCKAIERQMATLFGPGVQTLHQAVPAPDWPRLKATLPSRSGRVNPLERLAPKPRWTPALATAICLVLGFVAGLWIARPQPAPDAAMTVSLRQADPEQFLLTGTAVLSTQALYASYIQGEERP